MGSRGIMGMLRGAATAALPVNHHPSCPFSLTTTSFGYGLLLQKKNIGRTYSARSALEPPDLSRLAQTARISLTPQEVEEFAPKIQQVVDWFGQLQAVDLQSIEPAIRADNEGDNLRDDLPHIFENREAMTAAVPSYEDPYIKVPKVLNKE
ncbi:hypothetical protein RJ640_006342 [Escallonia rubra]|uniref:Glutamyl-tRNA(Gln) amidotransferase subunit C, chloroplastic/mitochondrial n=1 Tax=Escallonia rubra TaxID=112253 RepID=A0AA88RB43_9ASTE|nr:hypothetical protein RJ640_006342 [Escallonia rubra]